MDKQMHEKMRRDSARSSYSQWCDAISSAGKDYDRKRKEALEGIKKSSDWKDIRAVAGYLYVAEAMAVGEEGLKGFDALFWARQWHFVEQALNMLEAKKTVFRALGVLADDESSKVLAKMREIDHG